jgi:hypothetical protein
MNERKTLLNRIGSVQVRVYNLDEFAFRQSPTIELSINQRRASAEHATKQPLTRLGRTDAKENSE